MYQFGWAKFLSRVFHGLELCAVDRNTCIGQQLKLAPKGGKLNTEFTDRPAIVFTEYGDRLGSVPVPSDTATITTARVPEPRCERRRTYKVGVFSYRLR